MQPIHKKRKYIKVTTQFGKSYRPLIGNRVSKWTFQTAAAAELYAENVYTRYFRLIDAAKRAKAEGMAQ